MPRFRIGCTGWSYDDWQGVFYPRGTKPGDYLTHYSRAFDLTEVDSSFYAIPRRELAERWAATTPPGFTFAMKFPGDITHKGRLGESDELLTQFLHSIEPLREAGKLGPLVLQFPSSFRREKGERDLHDFLARWPRGRALAVELRHRSWWVPETYRALEAAGASLVWSYHETGRAPAVLTSDQGYARLIGDRALTQFDRIQRDLTPELRYWKERFEDEGRSAREFMLIVNNHLMGHAPASAVMLAGVLGVEPPDLAAARRGEGQQRLF